MTPEQLNEIIVDMEKVNSQGHNLICRKCRGTFKCTTRNKNGMYKSDNLRGNLYCNHKKDSTLQSSRLP